MSDTSIWMPIYWGDYMKDTSRLSLEQHGIYLMLIKEYWNNKAPFESDKIGIYRALGALEKREQDNVDLVLEKYFTLSGGLYIHERIDSEIKKAKENKDFRQERARAAAKSRWDANSNATSMPEAMQGAMLMPCTSPSPSVVDEETRTRFIRLSEKLQGILNSPLPLNTQRVREWWSWGASDTMIEETVSFVRSRMKDPPSTLKYFDKAIAGAIKQSQEPAPEVKDGNFKNGIRKTKSERIDEACARAAKDLGVLAE